MRTPETYLGQRVARVVGCAGLQRSFVAAWRKSRDTGRSKLRRRGDVVGLVETFPPATETPAHPKIGRASVRADPIPLSSQIRAALPVPRRCLREVCYLALSPTTR